MRSIYGDKPRVLDRALPQAEFAHNNSINSLTGMSTFSIVYRKIPHHLLDLAKLRIERSLVVQLAPWQNKY